MNENKQIMIVSSDISGSMYIKMQLHLAGFDVIAACPDGKNAVETARKSEPDFVIIDICLEGEIDGIQTAAEILKTTKTNIVFMTEYQKMDLLIKAMDLKPTWYFIKPFDIGKMKQVIETNSEVCA